MSNQSDFEKWQRQWDAAAEQFAKESASELAASARKQHDNQLQTSFFTDTPMDRDYQEPPLEDELSWHDIYARSQNIDGLITDSVEYTKGAEKPQQNFGAFTPVKRNPTQQSTTGADQEEDDTGRLRVTQNWGAGGDDLNELDQIKRDVEELERKHHRAEVYGDSSSSLKSELKGLRDRVRKLSEKINRGIDTDVT